MSTATSQILAKTGRTVPGSPWQNCFAERNNRDHPSRVRRPFRRTVLSGICANC